jgi:hypothetical protein
MEQFECMVRTLSNCTVDKAMASGQNEALDDVTKQLEKLRGTY